MKPRASQRFLTSSLLFCGGCIASVSQAFNAGVDVSALPVLEGAGTTYSAYGEPGDPIQILRNEGVDWFRLRLFVDPANDPDPFVVNDLSYTIALAQRVKAAGGKLLLDLHYSDTWADPGKQFKPAGWEVLNFNGLSQQLYLYSKQTIESFAAAGVLPEQVQVGNEVGNGLLWDDGRLFNGGRTDAEFDRLATLLQAGIDGVRDGAGSGPAPEIIVHHASGAQGAVTRFFFDELQERNVDFDAIGYSYYPRFHFDESTGDGVLADLTSNLNDTANRYGKPIYLVETAFPYTGAQFEPDYEFPVSVIGQSDFIEAVANAVDSVPNNLGGGVYWWYPEAVRTTGLSIYEDGREGLFNSAGELLPAARALGLASVATVPGDFNQDGIVDAGDYTVWRDGLGGAYSEADYQVWAANFGRVASTPASTVPEPGAAFALISALASLFARPRAI